MKRVAPAFLAFLFFAAWGTAAVAMFSGEEKSSAGESGTPESTSMPSPAMGEVAPGNGAIGMSWQMPGERKPGSGESQGIESMDRGGVPASVRAATDNEAAEPIEFDVWHVAVGTDWSAGRTETVTETRIEITGLTNGVVYAFRVRARQGEERSDWSETVYATPVAPVEAPGRPARPALAVGNGLVAVEWQAPEGGAATSYDLDIALEGQGWSSGPDPILGLTETTATVTDLANGTEYAFRVRAANAVGAGPWSGTAYAVPISVAESLARLEIETTLIAQARSLFEDASNVIGRRLSSSGFAHDPVSTLAALTDDSGMDRCSLEESLSECAERSFAREGSARTGFGLDRAVEHTSAFDLAHLRERVRERGFAMSLNGFSPETATSGTPALTLWGAGADSESAPLFFGLDARMGEDWMTGLAFAGTDSSGSWRPEEDTTRGSGLVESEVSAVYPYLRGRFRDGLQVWSLAGWGAGSFEALRGDDATPDAEATFAGDLGFDLGLVGAEQPLYRTDVFTFSALGDAGWSSLSAEGDADAEAQVYRTRLGVEGRYASEDRSFTSSLRASTRVDGGDGDGAQWTELAGALRFVGGRYEAGLEGRWYETVAELLGLREKGIQAVLALRPRTDGTGLGLTLSPSWGADPTAGNGLMAAFMEEESTRASDEAFRLTGRLSWGTKLRHRRLLRPYAAFDHVEDVSRSLRAGLELDGRVRMSLATERRETDAEGVDHSVLLRLDTRF